MNIDKSCRTKLRHDLKNYLKNMHTSDDIISFRKPHYFTD